MTILMRRYGADFANANWRAIVRRLHRNVVHATDRNDASFWWGERTLNGMLAGAFHRESHWSVVEPMARGHQGDRVRRPDLWLGFGGRNEGWFTLEAKLAWSRKPNPAAVHARLTVAEAQLRGLGDDFRTGSPLAACWVVPRTKREQLPRPAANEFLKRHARALWAHLVEHEEQDQSLVVAMAPEGPVHHNGIEFYPGVILCLGNRAGMWQGG